MLDCSPKQINLAKQYSVIVIFISEKYPFHLVLGHGLHCRVYPKSNICGQKCLCSDQYIRKTNNLGIKCPKSRDVFLALTNQPHDCSTEANLVLIIGGQIGICAIKIDFCISVCPIFFTSISSPFPCGSPYRSTIAITSFARFIPQSKERLQREHACTVCSHE